MANLTQEDRTAIVETSARLGIRPADLLAVMMYESAGTMDPDIQGGKGGKYTGLIQFGPHERRVYGYQPGMTVAEQVRGPVYNYLSDRGLPSGADLSTIYRTVNGGNPKAALWKSDRPGSTIATHIDTIARNYVPNAEAVMSGVALPEAGPTTGVSPAMMAVVSRARQLSDVKFGMFPTSGARTKAEQKALVKAGWSGTMNSKHIGGTAMDLVPMGPDGQADPDALEKYDEINRAMKQASAELGIPVKWGGDWKNPDRPHYQLVDPDAAAPPTPYDPLSGRLIPQQVAPPSLLGFSPKMMAELEAAKFPFRQPPPQGVSPQDARTAVAGLTNPIGGTLTPSIPAGTEAYAPFLPPRPIAPSPGQAAIIENFDQPVPGIPETATPPSSRVQAVIDSGEWFDQPGDLTADQIGELTRTDVAGNYTNPLVAPPPGRSPGPGGALGVDLGQQPSGMPPPPSRPGTFDWLGGGAPEAALVPPPGISPLRPAFGGPGDRRPQPPIPPSRAQGIPLPPMRPAPAASMENMPSSVGMPPSAPPGGAGAFSGIPGPMSLEALLSPVRASSGAPGASPDDSRVAAIQSMIDQGVTDPSEIWGNLNMDRDGNLVGDITTAEIQAVLDRGQRSAPNAQAAIADEFGPGTPFSQIGLPPVAPPLERANRIAGGQGGPVIPITPDEMAASLANASANRERTLGVGWRGNLGTPETQMSLERTFPPPLSGIDERMDRAFSEAQSRGLARELGFNRRQMEGYTAPPPSPFAEARTKDDPYALPGPVAGFDRAARASQIMGLPPDLNVGAFPPSPAEDPYTQQRMSSFDTSRPYSGFTPPPRYADLPSISGGGGSDVLGASPEEPASPFRYDPLSSARLNLPSSVPAVPSIPGTRFLPPDADPNNITLPTEPLKITSPVQDADVANQTVTVPPPLRTAANAGVTAPSQAKTPESQKRRSSSSSPSLLARIGNALVPGNPFGPGGGGVGGFGFGIGPGGFFSNAGSFTPSGAGGTSFFNQQPNGTMGTTNWRQGSVTGNPAMSGVMWNRSGDNGSVGYVTNPFNDSLIYSGSPNRF